MVALTRSGAVVSSASVGFYRYVLFGPEEVDRERAKPRIDLRVGKLGLAHEEQERLLERASRAGRARPVTGQKPAKPRDPCAALVAFERSVKLDEVQPPKVLGLVDQSFK